MVIRDRSKDQGFPYWGIGEASSTPRPKHLLILPPEKSCIRLPQPKICSPSSHMIYAPNF